MKKIFPLLTLCVCIYSTVLAQTPNNRAARTGRTRLSQINFVERHLYKTSAAELNLKKQVRSIREEQYSAAKNGNKLEKLPFDDKNRYYSFYSSLKTFNEAGDVINDTYYNKDGSVDYSVEYTYSKPGMISQSQIFNGKHELTKKIVREYDDKDYNISTTEFDNTGTKTRQEKYIYKFPSNRSYEMQYVNNDGSVNPDVQKYTYNTDTLLSDAGQLNPASAFSTFYTMYEYDSLKHIITETLYVSLAREGEDTRTIGYRISTVKKYEYDLYGNMIKMNEEFIYKGESNFYTDTYEYTYDSKGNWIKKVSSGNSPSLGENKYEVTERKIRYF